MATLLLDDGPIDTAHFASDQKAYGASLEAALRPHIRHVLVSRVPGQTEHANVVQSLGLGVASVVSLLPGKPVREHVELAAIGVVDGMFLPERELVAFFGNRGLECRTCGTVLQQA